LRTEPPPEFHIFFLDRCLGKRIVAARLRAAGFAIEIHADHFPETESLPEESDREWLKLAGEKRWVVLSKNKHIRRNQIEIAEILTSEVAAFISTATNVSGEQIADSFLAAMPAISTTLRNYARPFLATVSKSGIVKVLLDRDALERTSEP
jgi:hypothetical protein